MPDRYIVDSESLTGSWVDLQGFIKSLVLAVDGITSFQGKVLGVIKVHLSLLEKVQRGEISVETYDQSNKVLDCVLWAYIGAGYCVSCDPFFVCGGCSNEVLCSAVSSSDTYASPDEIPLDRLARHLIIRMYDQRDSVCDAIESLKRVI